MSSSSSSIPSLAGIDLNLLVALDALLREANVTRAGKAIGLSQSASSHALARLRELLGDPLLLRSKSGMRRSALGDRLLTRLPALLDDIRETLFETGRDFDPASSTREIILGANDYVGATVLPALTAQLATRAPGLRLLVRHLPGEPDSRELAAGRMDLAIGSYRRPPSLRSETLFEDDFRCVLRQGHPSVGKRLSLRAYLSVPHILITSPGEGPGVVDFALAELGKERQVAVRLPHFLVAPALVASTDYVLTLASRLAEHAASQYALRCMKPPLPLPSFAVTMSWDRRSDRDPALLWLMHQIRLVCGA